jgi:S-adenosylmethionine decarboxylase
VLRRSLPAPPTVVLVGRGDVPDAPGVIMADLAPMILRQRLFIEGTCPEPIDGEQIKRYLTGLSEVTGMTVLIDPVTHRSDLHGWAGWIHWETSGAHFYSWEQPLLFFSVDIYTCKAFSATDAISYTQAFFDTEQIAAKSF